MSKSTSVQRTNKMRLRKSKHSCHNLIEQVGSFQLVFLETHPEIQLSHPQGLLILPLLDTEIPPEVKESQVSLVPQVFPRVPP